MRCTIIFHAISISNMLYNAEYRITMKDQKDQLQCFDEIPQDLFKLHTFTALFHTSYPTDIITFIHVLSLDVSHYISSYLLFQIHLSYIYMHSIMMMESCHHFYRPHHHCHQLSSFHLCNLYSHNIFNIHHSRI